MKRNAIDNLILWKDKIGNNWNKPVLITGAKGVGKTYLAYDFANSFFSQTFYINLEKDQRIRGLLSSGDPDSICKLLSDYRPINKENIDITDTLNKDNIVFILDEISYLPDIEGVIEILLELQGKSMLTPYILLTSSKPLSAEVMAKTYPVKLFPLTFDEFLLATGNDWYIEAIRTHYDNCKPLPEIVHNELISLYQLYLEIGGMPSAVNEYLHMNSTINIMEHHDVIMGAYKYDITNSNSDNNTLKILQVFDSISYQLKKVNKKFQYRLIRKGTTYGHYKEAIDYLINNNLVIQSNKIPNDQLTNSSSVKDFQPLDANFKLYMPDTGLLFTQFLQQLPLNLKFTAEPVTHNMYTDSKIYKTLIENNVAQTLNANHYSLWYWESNSSAKINFIIEKDTRLIPVEIFHGTNTRSKSVSIFKKHCDIPYGIKISSNNFAFVNQVKYLPIYATFCL
ncbi:MAG: AAA family ATPase [Clostridiales bacterium]|nr:AAA family ATPase [Clostridiales bacterium]